MSAERIRIEVSAWSGNVKPWRGIVYAEGADSKLSIVGKTGFCATQSRAQRAAERIAARFAARASK